MGTNLSILNQSNSWEQHSWGTGSGRVQRQSNQQYTAYDKSKQAKYYKSPTTDKDDATGKCTLAGVRFASYSNNHFLGVFIVVHTNNQSNEDV